MVDTISADIFTSGFIFVNDQVGSNIDTIGDRDWFSVFLTAGRPVTIDMNGAQFGLGSLSDPYLILRDSGGGFITFDDDDYPDNTPAPGGIPTFNAGFDSRLVFMPTVSGEYFIDAGAYLNSRTGTYLLRVRDTFTNGNDVVRVEGFTTSTWNGLGGNDTIIGSTFGDKIFGAAGNDIIAGDAGDDNLAGGDGNDRLGGGLGNDTLNGGLGVDTVAYTQPGTVRVDLAIMRVAQNTGAGGIDTIDGVENILATAFNDFLFGNTAANTLFGENGNDTLDGRTGNDFLYGGLGKDTMTGGLGLDDFVYRSVAEIGNGATRDRISDFAVGQDDIDLSLIDANGAAAGNAAFRFNVTKGAAFDGVQGRLVWTQVGTNTIVLGDVDGNRVADFQIELAGLKTLTAAEFIL